VGEIAGTLRSARLQQGESRERDASRGSAPGVGADAAPPFPVPAREESAEHSEVADAFVPSERSAGDRPPEEGVRSVAIRRDKADFWMARAVLVDHPGPRAECFRHFALQLRRELENRKIRSVLVTSALPQEGKTVTACNLALALASMTSGRRVALVDLDFRSPAVARGMGITAEVGLERVISREVPLRSACMRTDVPALDLFAARHPLRRPHELLATPVVSEVLLELTRRYATVVCDAPPVLPVPDVLLTVPHVGGCVVVARAGETRRSTFLPMLELLPREKLIGGFLNEARLPRFAKQYVHYPADEGEPEPESPSPV
jgi:Mrp family chromosome partitioning ATPase